MNDVVVIQSLRERGYNMDNLEEILMYEAIEKKPRVLDKPPKRLSLVRGKDLPVYSTYTEFLMTFKDKKDSNTLDTAQLNIKGVVRYCDVDVFLVLQSLISEGFTKSADKARACFDLFRVIMMTPGDTVTIGRVHESLTDYLPINFYAGELYKAICNCLFEDTPLMLYWIELANYDKTYKKAVRLGKTVILESDAETESDVDKLCKQFYSEYKDDEDFVAKYAKEFRKTGATKPLIGMIHHLYKEHPEVLDFGEIVPNKL